MVWFNCITAFRSNLDEPASHASRYSVELHVNWCTRPGRPRRRLIKCFTDLSRRGCAADLDPGSAGRGLRDDFSCAGGPATRSFDATLP